MRDTELSNKQFLVLLNQRKYKGYPGEEVRDYL